MGVNDDLIRAIVDGVKETLGAQIKGHDAAILKLDDINAKNSCEIFNLKIQILKHKNRIAKVEVQCKNNESDILKIDEKLESIKSNQGTQNDKIDDILEKVKFKRAAVIAWATAPGTGAVLLWFLNWLGKLLKIV